jgi:hypothetical protein
VAAIGLVLPDGMPVARGLVILQLALLALLTLGAIFDDRLGRLLQQSGAVVLFLMSVAAICRVPQPLSDLPQGILDRYALLLVAVAIGYGVTVRSRLYFAEAGAVLGLWLTVVGWRAYLFLRQLIVGLDLIVWGLAFFLLAAFISLKKAGAFPNRFVWKRPQNEL